MGLEKARRDRATSFGLVWVAWAFLGLLASVVAAASPSTGSAWAQGASPELRADARVTWGELPNGFRFAILPHGQGAGLISLRFMVGAGSIDEGRGERGLAHFVEHMVFKGTRDFSASEMTGFFQSIGMSFGDDVNAFTYHDRTVYHLELPRSDLALLQRSLNLLRNYADGALFPESEIETERLVIQREREARELPSVLVAKESFNFAFDGTRLAERDPIGERKVIDRVSKKQLQQFYAKWYRPDLMTLVVVGDVSSDAVEALIEEAFAGMLQPSSAPPARKIGKPGWRIRPRTGGLPLAAADRYSLEISRAWSDPWTIDTAERRRIDILRRFATSLFNERCRLALDGVSARFATYERIQGLPFCRFTTTSGGEEWTDGFAWMDRMLRQVREAGFQAKEFAAWKERLKQILVSNESYFSAAEPSQMIDDLVEHIANGEVYLSPSDYRAFTESCIADLKLDEVNECFREIWNPAKLSYFVAGDHETRGRKRQLQRALKVERETPPPPFLYAAQDRFSYSPMSRPGEVLESSRIEALGAYQYRFDNNLRLTFLQTRHEPGVARALLRVGDGVFGLPDANPAEYALALSSLFRSGVGNHSVDQVYGELRSHVATFDFDVARHDSFNCRLVASPEGLEHAFRILSEYLLNPKLTREAFLQSQESLTQIRRNEVDGLSLGLRQLERLLYPQFARFHAPNLQEIAQADLSRVRPWVEEAFRSGYIELVVVGDIEREALLDSVARTLGALPERQASKRGLGLKRSLELQPERGQRTIVYPGGLGGNAASVVVWTIQEKVDLSERAALYVLSRIMENRLRGILREDLGMSYAPSVRYESQLAYENLRHLRADVDCAGADAAIVGSVVLSTAADLARNLVTEQELAAAVVPLRQSVEKAWKDNGYLLDSVLYGANEYPEMIPNALRYRDGALDAVTPSDLRLVARKYLRSQEALRVAIVPEPPHSIGEAEAKGPRARAGLTR